MILEEIMRIDGRTLRPRPREEISMSDTEIDPVIVKVLEYAKEKKTISFDELSDMLPEQILNSDKMEAIINLLVSSNIKIEEEVQAEEEVLPRLIAVPSKSKWSPTTKKWRAMTLSVSI